MENRQKRKYHVLRKIHNFTTKMFIRITVQFFFFFSRQESPPHGGTTMMNFLDDKNIEKCSVT